MRRASVRLEFEPGVIAFAQNIVAESVTGTPTHLSGRGDVFIAELGEDGRPGEFRLLGKNAWISPERAQLTERAPPESFASFVDRTLRQVEESTDPFAPGSPILIDRKQPSRADGRVEDQHGNLWSPVKPNRQE